ncbi:MAG: hypothetical protein IIB73_06595 [Proteobacteria bacterium]|nr:hypothetical protein [Pseudomonadota bacterium]
MLSRYGARLGATADICEGLGIPMGVDYSGGGLIRSYGGWQHLLYARKEHERKVGDERILGDEAAHAAMHTL